MGKREARTKLRRKVRYKPNKYRLQLEKPADDEPRVEVTNENTVIEVARQLCTVKEIRHYVKRREYDNRWR